MNMATSNLSEAGIMSNVVENSEREIGNGYEAEVVEGCEVAHSVQEMTSTDSCDRSFSQVERGVTDSALVQSSESSEELSTLEYDESTTTTTTAKTTTGDSDAESFHQASPPSYAVCSQQQSYIALISMAILRSPNKRLVLSDIYRSLSAMIPSRYNNTSRAWRNSIRHNLSLNECFIKAGRSLDGKGNYWAIHPACVEDFSRGDYRRRQARRRAVESIDGKTKRSISTTSTDKRGQGQGRPTQAPVYVETNNQQVEDTTDFERMSCVTVLTGFSSSLTPADIVGMLPPPWEVFSTGVSSSSSTKSSRSSSSGDSV